MVQLTVIMFISEGWLNRAHIMRVFMECLEDQADYFNPFTGSQLLPQVYFKVSPEEKQLVCTQN